MGLCDDILKKDIIPSCDDPLISGFEQEGVIINKEDVDLVASEMNATRKNVIETLALKATKRGYKCVIPGKTPYTGTKSTMTEGKFSNTFDHAVELVVLNNDPDVCADIIDGLANGTYVVVLENKFKALEKSTTPGDAAFQVYGWHQGLNATAIENDKYSEDTDGGWAVTLTEKKSPKSAMFMFKTDYATTKAAFATLTT